MRWVGHLARMGDRQSAYRVFMEKSERKRSLGRPKRRWEDNIKWIFRQYDSGTWNELICLRIGTVSESCKLGN
jgi:hypothetical protein